MEGGPEKKKKKKRNDGIEEIEELAFGSENEER